MPVNTGEQQAEQRDVNPGSPTFGQVRWVAAGTNIFLCPLPRQRFRSAAISATVYRNDCGTGTSSGVLYNLPAGQVVSTVSQSDADTQARAYFDASSQPYALANAVCTTTTPPGGVPFCQMIGQTVRGCWTGRMIDRNGVLSDPTPQDCSECNGKQDPSCNLVSC